MSVLNIARAFWFHFSNLIARSFLIVFIVAFFAGSVLMGHAVAALELVGGGPVAGYIVGLGGVRELFPLFAGAVIAARTGADISSQLAIFKLSEQVDALEMMGFSKQIYLALPRLLACVIGAPLLVMFSGLAGLLGAYFAGALEYKINQGELWLALWQYVTPFDFWGIALKGILFGGVIAAISIRAGFAVSGGPVGVKRCVNKTIVSSMIVGSLSNLLCTFLFYGKDSF